MYIINDKIKKIDIDHSCSLLDFASGVDLTCSVVVGAESLVSAVGWWSPFEGSAAV